MIFEDEHSVLQDSHNLSFVKNIINFQGDKSFILNSLQKIKNNTLCKIKRKTINKLIKDYTRHLNYIENEDIGSKPDNYELSPVYARRSYNKVVRENEYLEKVMALLMNQ
ncbi:hypothetical protein SD427_10925 [Chryseobacterium sp. JJR-5R]|uniref:hypothetical protein n=1 Tax=Chryseobacterium sp. JJR-5R TaxID=3093923 RepID=UPI002A760795|nr:hypothetical protein [Chryseobacterium sp. JJR-5R]WPO81275.1 hypothetical protein SD427_10925 [Chryseobacterium sp. JJR-5R]